MIETIILLLILITLGSVLKKSEIICIIALLLTLLIPEYRTYTILIIAIGILNIFSMFLMKNQIKGVDYSLIALITLATIYVVYT
ncbi:MAG TPA: NADH-quinone oxidoreductase subunit N, partial [Archaeoglobus profundus]|nr:NADH-quinone oxidoreductase subunit N [Archaeoglobus profundus]